MTKHQLSFGDGEKFSCVCGWTGDSFTEHYQQATMPIPADTLIVRRGVDIAALVAMMTDALVAMNYGRYLSAASDYSMGCQMFLAGQS